MLPLTNVMRGFLYTTLTCKHVHFLPAPFFRLLTPMRGKARTHTEFRDTSHLEDYIHHLSVSHCTYSPNIKPKAGRSKVELQSSEVKMSAKVNSQEQKKKWILICLLYKIFSLSLEIGLEKTSFFI